MRFALYCIVISGVFGTTCCVSWLNMVVFGMIAYSGLCRFCVVRFGIRSSAMMIFANNLPQSTTDIAAEWLNTATISFRNVKLCAQRLRMQMIYATKYDDPFDKPLIFPHFLIAHPVIAAKYDG